MGVTKREEDSILRAIDDGSITLNTIRKLNLDLDEEDEGSAEATGAAESRAYAADRVPEPPNYAKRRGRVEWWLDPRNAAMDAAWELTLMFWRLTDLASDPSLPVEQRDRIASVVDTCRSIIFQAPSQAFVGSMGANRTRLVQIVEQEARGEADTRSLIRTMTTTWPGRGDSIVLRDLEAAIRVWRLGKKPKGSSLPDKWDAVNTIAKGLGFGASSGNDYRIEYMRRKREERARKV